MKRGFTIQCCENEQIDKDDQTDVYRFRVSLPPKEKDFKSDRSTPMDKFEVTGTFQ